MRFFDCLKKAWGSFVDCMCEERAPASREESLPETRARLLGLLAARPVEEKAPETAKSGAPYRAPATIVPPPPPEWEELCVDHGSRIMCKVVRRGELSLEQFESVRKKAQRRAVRHFRGKEVRHRVVRKDATEIEFAFYRRSNKGPVKLALRKEEIEPNVSQVGSA